MANYYASGAFHEFIFNLVYGFGTKFYRNNVYFSFHKAALSPLII
jgi:hypothetical protein